MESILVHGKANVKEEFAPGGGRPGQAPCRSRER